MLQTFAHFPTYQCKARAQPTMRAFHKTQHHLLSNRYSRKVLSTYDVNAVKSWARPTWTRYTLDRLQIISKTGVDSRGREGIPGDSIDGEKRRGIKVLRRKSCAINQLVDCG